MLLTSTMCLLPGRESKYKQQWKALRLKVLLYNFNQTLVPAAN